MPGSNNSTPRTAPDTAVMRPGPPPPVDESVMSTVFDDESPSTLEPRNRLNTGDDQPPEPQLSGCAAFCANVKALGPAFRVGFFIFLMGLPQVLSKPVLVDVKKDYFGSDQKAALVGTIIDATVATINLFMAIMYGRALDAFGRRPFFIAAASFSIAAYAALTALPTQPLVFMIINGASQLVQGSYMTAYLADIAPPERRPQFFGVVVAVSMIVLLFALFGALLDVANRIMFAIGLGVSIIALLYAVFVIKESLPKEDRKPLTVAGSMNPIKGVDILFRSRVLIICTVILIIQQIADIGLGEVYLLYLNQRAGFTKQDFSYMFVEVSFAGPLALVVLMPLLLKKLSPSLVMSVALAGNAGVCIIIATIWAKWPIFAFAIPMAGIMEMIGPIIQGIITNTGSEDEIAKRLTATTAVTDVCSAIAPLPFGVLYSQLHGTLAAIPFFVSCALCVVASFLATRIAPAVERDVKREAEEEAAAEGLALDDEEVHQRTEARLRAATVFRSTDDVAEGTSKPRLTGASFAARRSADGNSQPLLREDV